MRIAKLVPITVVNHVTLVGNAARGVVPTINVQKCAMRCVTDQGATTHAKKSCSADIHALASVGSRALVYVEYAKSKRKHLISGVLAHPVRKLKSDIYNSVVTIYLKLKNWINY